MKDIFSSVTKLLTQQSNGKESILKKIFPWDAFKQLLRSFEKKTTGPGLCCLSINADGIRCAYVIRDKQAKPELQWCKFIPSNDLQKATPILTALVKEHNLHNVPCSWLLDFNDYKLLTVEALPVPANELAAALRWRIKDLIDFLINEAILDFFPAPVTAIGKASNLNVVVSRQQPIQATLEILRSCGFKVTTIDIPELALRNITALFPDDEQGLALLWLRPIAGRMIITQKAALYFTRYIDQPLAELFTSNGEIPAERLQVILEGLSLEVQRSLDYYHSQLHQANLVKILVTPPQAVVLNYLSEHLTVKPSTLELQSVLRYKEPLADELLMQCLAVIGGALREEANNAATN